MEILLQADRLRLLAAPLFVAENAHLVRGLGELRVLFASGRPPQSQRFGQGPIRVVVAADALDQPDSLAALSTVPGVGKKKLERYGEEFLGVIAEHG